MESDEEFDFGPAEEAEEENRGRNRKKESKIARQGGDIAKKGVKAKTKTWSNVLKGLKTEDELKIANSGESAIQSKVTDSIEMFDSDITNRLRAKRRKGQQKRRQNRNSKGAEKGHTSRQADRKGQGMWNRMSRGAQARHEARRSRSKDLEEQAEPQVEVEGEFGWI